ncbi:YncE family protein [Cryobacterium sp. Y82]|uniref:YncE family protein n=1 Tax=Cryobacterium sp. Y82 TaxID=2045017 RepID=UPI001304A40D|nr:YncE family protein [Cryobacterium sp. Y82]
MTVTVTGTKAGYKTVSKTSAPTGLVKPATIAVGTNPRDLVVTADGRWAYVANSGSRTVSVIAVTTGKVVATIPLGGTPLALAVSANQKQVFVSTCSDKKIYALNIASNTVAYSFSAGACGDLVATPDGKSLYIGGSPTLFDITVATIVTRSLAEPIFTGAPVGALTPSTDRKKVYLSNGDDYGVLIIDTAAPQGPINRFNTSHPPIASVPSPDGTTVSASLGRDLITGPSNAVEVIDTATNRVRASIAINAPGALAVNPDGSKLYVVSTENNTVVTVSTVTNRVLSRITVGLPRRVSPSRRTAAKWVLPIPTTARCRCSRCSEPVCDGLSPAVPLVESIVGGNGPITGGVRAVRLLAPTRNGCQRVPVVWKPDER